MKYRKFITNLSGLAPLVTLAAISAQAHAETAAVRAPAWEVEAGIDLVSDYRFRGISLSGKDPAFQPSLTVTHASGIYAGFWGSTIADNGGESLETDLLLGYEHALGPVTFNFGASWYLYPGMPADNYLELSARAAVTMGEAEMGLSYAYAPSQRHIGDIDNHYFSIDGSVPVPHTPVSLKGSFGIENGAFGDDKLDWTIGISSEIKGFTLGASYVDSAHSGGEPMGSATLLISLGHRF